MLRDDEYWAQRHRAHLAATHQSLAMATWAADRGMPDAEAFYTERARRLVQEVPVDMRPAHWRPSEPAT